MQTVILGSTGPDVRLLQITLNRLGYQAGAVDGDFGARTEQAVLRFQSDFGLTPDGIVGPATWSVLTPYIAGYAVRTIRPGDTLYGLASEFYTTVSAIETANPGIDPDNLQVGQRVTVPYGYDVVPFEIYYTYEILDLYIRGLKARYPFLEVTDIGRSTMGKRLYCVRLGRGPREVSYNAAHHANEWITVGILMKFIEFYSKAYAAGGNLRGVDIRRLFEEASLYIVPMVNPDGVNLVTYWPDYPNPAYDRAAQLNTTGENLPSVWKANIQGTDLNLNYPAGWEQARQIWIEQGITGPAPRDYGGPAPFSAPETAAMRDFTRAHPFGLVIAYHTQGEVIYWQFENYAPPESESIAETFANLSGYTPVAVAGEAAYAGYKDWFLKDFGRPGFTVEAGLGVNPLPVEQLPEIYSRNEGILLAGPAVY